MAVCVRQNPSTGSDYEVAVSVGIAHIDAGESFFGEVWQLENR